MSFLLRFAGSLLLAAAVPLSSLEPCALAASATLSRQQQALHMLNRFTFGPMPGEAQQVAKQGVYRWFDQQLHPLQISDAALDARLADYPEASLPVATLFADYPSPNQVRQAINGRLTPPAAEPESAVWQSQMARIEQKRADRRDAGQQSQSGQPAQPVGDSRPLPDAQSLLAMPAAARLQALLTLPPDSMQQLVRTLPPRQRPLLITGFSPAQRDTVFALVNPRLVVVNETESARLLRDIYSQRQVEQVMTEFWLNHFNIATNKDGREPYYLASFENDAIAPHALGRFEDLLDAVAESPAMLIYLDNVQSIGPDSQAAQRRERVAAAVASQTKKADRKAGINENYGRELMELHTVGVNGGYTQQDVIEAAKVLTGWTVAPPQQGGGFRFAANLHEPGSKTVMGHTIAEGGQQEGLELLHILATSPATARMLSTQLAVRFVGDNPSPALVNRMVQTYMHTHGDISAVLTTMVHAPQFWTAADTGNKVKTPLDYVVSAVRATNAQVTQPYRLVAELRVMGMPLTGTQEPNGYAMTNDAWASSSQLVDRLNFALALACNRIPGVAVSMTGLAGPFDPEQSPARQEEKLEHALLGGPATPLVHQAVLRSLNDPQGSADAAAKLVLTGYQAGSPFAGPTQAPDTAAPSLAVPAGLLLGSPEFQRR